MFILVLASGPRQVKMAQASGDRQNEACVDREFANLLYRDRATIRIRSAHRVHHQQPRASSMAAQPLTSETLGPRDNQLTTSHCVGY